MRKEYDLILKLLTEKELLALLKRIGLTGEKADLVNTEISSVVLMADRLLRVSNPDYIVHLEFQTTYDSTMGFRLLRYHVFAFEKFGLPIKSIVVLLRREADGPQMTGRFEYGEQVFHYSVLRVWELPVEDLLSGPVGLLPLASIASRSVGELPEVLGRIESRIGAECSVGEGDFLLFATYILLGLRPERDFARSLLKGVERMRESSTYQAILEEGMAEGIKKGMAEGVEKGMAEGVEKGMAEGVEKGRDEGRGEGRVEGALRTLLSMGRLRLGEPNAQAQAELESIHSAEEVEVLAPYILSVETWQDLLKHRS